MGEPDNMTIEVPISLFLSLLSPAGQASAYELRKAGLHAEVLSQHFEAMRPEMKYMVGWKSLEEFDYVPRSHYVSDEHVDKAIQLTLHWREELESNGLIGVRAIEIYDGEGLPQPAPDYRLYLLRDERLLYYAGGFHAPRFETPRITCGNPMEVLRVIDPSFNSRGVSGHTSTQPFVVIMNALNDALDKAVQERERLAQKQRALHEQLVQLTGRLY